MEVSGSTVGKLVKEKAPGVEVSVSVSARDAMDGRDCRKDRFDSCESVLDDNDGDDDSKGCVVLSGSGKGLAGSSSDRRRCLRVLRAAEGREAVVGPAGRETEGRLEADAEEGDAM